MDRKERGAALAAQVDGFVEDLSQELAKGHTEHFLEVLDFYSRNFHAYSISNCWLIFRQKPNATRCAGFKLWEKLGCQVRKGEKAIWIRGPWLKKQTDPETGEVEEKLLGYIALAVFDISQVDGAENLPTHRHPLSGAYGSIANRLEQAALAHGIQVAVEATPGALGTSSGDRITLKPGMSDSDRCLTLIHEVAHSLLHHGEDREDIPRPQRELEAEATALVVARTLGLDNPFAVDYITAFGGTVQKLHESLGRIHSAVKTISGWLEAGQDGVQDAPLAAD